MASARALRAGKAVIELSLISGDVEKQLKKIQAKMRDFGTTLKGYGAMGLAVSGAITAPLLAATKLAADAQEEMAKFKSVFGDQADAANQFAEALAAAIGRSATDIRSGMNAFQGFFVGLGFGNDEARKFTEQLQSLSHDFAAFHNLSDEEGMERFISALSGSSEVLDKFGINTRQAALEQALLKRGIDRSWTAVTEQEKAVARLDVIMKAMTDQGAVGAATRESGSFANQLKRLQGQMKDVGITLGTVVLPPVLDFLKGLNGIAAKVGEWASANPGLTKTVAALGVAIGVASVAAIAFGGILTVLAAHPVIAGLAALGVAVTVLAMNFDEVTAATRRWREELDKIWALKAMIPMLDPALKAWTAYDAYKELQKNPLSEKFVNTNPSAPFAATPSIGAVGPAKEVPTAPFNASAGIGAAISAFERGMWSATDNVIRGGRTMFDALEKQKQYAEDHASELQAVEDEASRLRIGAMKDEAAREKSLIQFETRVRMRELQEQGLLSDELRGKILGLQDLQLGGVNAVDAQERVQQQVALFDARNSRQAFGGDTTNTILRQQLASLKKIERKDGGLPVV